MNALAISAQLHYLSCKLIEHRSFNFSLQDQSSKVKELCIKLKLNVIWPANFLAGNEKTKAIAKKETMKVIHSSPFLLEYTLH